MEQQLTILCSEDLVDTVTRTLNNILDQGYVHLPHAYGVKPKEHIAVDTALTFPASLFLVTSSVENVGKITAALQQYANQCRVKPCLKLVVSEILFAA